MSHQTKGKVFLVGAGPGDADLISVRGKRLLHECDAIVYDNLITLELIVGLPRSVALHYVGKEAGHHSLPQEEINGLLVRLAREGKKVVRLKGGDPFVFGRGGEEAMAIAEAGLEFEVVPGITAGIAAPAYAGIPATFRHLSSYAMLATAHEAIKPDSDHVVPWEWVAKAKQGTLLGYMGVTQLPQLMEQLIKAGLNPRLPAAIIERGTFGKQRTVQASAGELAEKARAAGIKPPALFVLGEVAQLADKLNWYERKPLFGLRIMVIRPADQCGELYRNLRDLGADVLPLPTSRTEGHIDDGGWNRLQASAGNNPWLFFASENGVRYFLRQWHDRGYDLRALSAFRIGAMGAGTLRAFDDAGINPDLVASKSSTAILAQEIANKLTQPNHPVFRICGNIVNDPPDQILKQHGAALTGLPVYRSVVEHWEEIWFEHLAKHMPDLLMCTSGTSVTFLKEILGDDRFREFAAKVPAATIGPTTTAVARDLGLTIAVEAKVWSIEGLIDAIHQHHKSHASR